MIAKEAVRRTLILLDAVGRGLEFGPQGELIPGWEVRTTSNAELRARSFPPVADDRDVFGLTVRKDRCILLDEEYLKDDRAASELIIHEVTHVFSGSHRCQESTGSDSPEFAACRKIVSDCEMLLFTEGEEK